MRGGEDISINYQQFKEKHRYTHGVILPAFEHAGIDPGRMKDCGDTVYAIECQSCGSNHFSGFYRCKSRWCVSCNHVRSLAWVARLIPVVEEWRQNGGYVGKLNLTIKNTEKLDDGLEILSESWRNFTNGRGNRKKFKERFPGGVRSLEVTFGEGGWHPHYHCLYLQSDYGKDFDWLKGEWEKYTSLSSGSDGKSGSIWIQAIYTDPTQSDGKALIKAVIEVIKYITDSKMHWFDPWMAPVLKEAHKSLKGVRQMNTWGSLRGLSAQVEKDIEQLNEKKLTEFICQKCGCTEGELRRLLYRNNLELFDLP